jgi:hypothetical protein
MVLALALAEARFERTAVDRTVGVTMKVDVFGSSAEADVLGTTATVVVPETNRQHVSGEKSVDFDEGTYGLC